MKVVISPAKTMKDFTFAYGESVQMPRYQKETMAIYQLMHHMDLQELCAFCKISEKLGRKCLQDYQEWRFDDMGTPAIFAYHGIQYLALNPHSFNEAQLQYANEHVRILSGLYGALRPLDCVYPYRLEMQAPICVGNAPNLYHYWMKYLHDDLSDDVLIDLASQEYSAVIDPSMKASKQYVRILFFVEQNGKRKAISTAIKAARGAMVHEIIKHQIHDVEALKDLAVKGFCFDPKASTEQTWIYVWEK